MELKRKRLLVLDLDETLIYATKISLDHAQDFILEKYFVYKRPGLDTFLSEMNEHFNLAIWSSASDDYVEAVVKEILPKDIKLAFIWGRSRCVYRRNFDVYDEISRTTFASHYNFVKPLRKLKRQGFDLNQILIVDDTPHKSQDNYGNAIYPQEFIGDQKDNELKYLTLYLKYLDGESDIRSIEKRNWRAFILKKLEGE